MNLDIYAVVIFCIISALLSLVLKQYRPEFAMMLSMACSIIVVLYLMESIADIQESLAVILTGTAISQELLGVVFKSLGICILSELASQSCKDAGENAIALKVELAGKIALALVGLPLFYQLLQTATRLLRF